VRRRLEAYRSGTCIILYINSDSTTPVVNFFWFTKEKFQGLSAILEARSRRAANRAPSPARPHAGRTPSAALSCSLASAARHSVAVLRCAVLPLGSASISAEGQME
jgi:hypothetical protein